MKTKPYRHQAEEFEVSKDAEARALLWQMRTGKSKLVVDTACHLWSELAVDAVLVLAPNGVHSNWTRREFPTHGWDDVPWECLTWRSSRPGMDGEVDAFLRRAGLPVLTVNSEALIASRVQRAIKGLLRRGRVMAVFDESHGFRRPGAKRTRLARTLAKRCSHRRILTGTPVLNSPLHAFSQFELLGPEALGHRTFADFKRRYAIEETRRTRAGRMYQAIADYQNLEELRERMAPWSSVVLRSDVDDMPEVVPVDVPVYLSAKQADAYRRLVDEWLCEIDEGSSVEVTDGGPRAMKLRQILGGWFYDEAGVAHSVDDDPPRLRALVDLVEGNWPGKTIVWCLFHEDIRRVTAALRSRGVGCVEYHGRVPAAQRDRNEDLFREDPGTTAFVGQQQAGGQGLDLGEADLIAWYSYSSDAIVWEQAQERATRIGGRSVGMAVLHTPDTIEDATLDVLEGRRARADMLSGSGLVALLRATGV